ncbi:MAG TPA: diguanylate cyclase [Burkholderiales bacterium]|jgi:diguanylate cyclase|nr:diguanylate cyclase [Burkholderiales bacterium]
MSTVPSSNTNPTEVARETIRRLAMERIAPTPDNYGRLYAEISGEEAIHPAAQALIDIGSELARLPGAGATAGRAMLQSLKRQKWDEVKEQLQTLTRQPTGEPPAWHVLLRDMLKQWELRHEGLPQGRKRDALEHVLDNSRSDAGKMFLRLSALVKSWAETPVARVTESALSADKAADSDELPGFLRDVLAQTLDFAVTNRLGYSPQLAGEGARISALFREARSLKDCNKAAQALQQLWLKLELRGESVDELMRGLLTLIKLLTQNIGELAGGDDWLKNQMERADLLLTEPLDVKALHEAERSFREVVYRQSSLKSSLDSAKTALKTMVGMFIDRLGQLSESTGGYQEKFAAYATQIEAASDIRQLSDVLSKLVTDTRGAQADMQATREELLRMREDAQAHEEQVRALEKELDEVGRLVKEDPLTSTLNRRGMEEAFAVESARTERAGAPLAVALLDVDNFKQLNDKLGHQAGDEALKYLATVLRQTIRPSDAVARYGGEEFVLLLPATDHAEAVRVMTRVQRTLTRKFFLHNNERVLITFSAGVAVRTEGEGRDELIARADGAMYQAKQSGKNRVCVAD